VIFGRIEFCRHALDQHQGKIDFVGDQLRAHPCTGLRVRLLRRQLRNSMGIKAPKLAA
jgi:hypothetical protein